MFLQLLEWTEAEQFLPPEKRKVLCGGRGVLSATSRILVAQIKKQNVFFMLLYAVLMLIRSSTYIEKRIASFINVEVPVKMSSLL